MSDDIKVQPPDLPLERILQRALLALYNPAELAQSPLIQLLRLPPERNPAQALYQVLIDAVEAMKPSSRVSQQAAAWRNYRILLYRYVQQIAQREVAVSMGFSVRQLQRHEQTALLALSSCIQNRFAINQEQAAPAEKVSTFDELERLRGSFADQAANPGEIIQAALETVTRLLEQAQVRVENLASPSLPPVAVQVFSLRQAFVILLSSARHMPGGKLTITAAVEGDLVRVLLAAAPISGAGFPLESLAREELALARELVTLSGGKLNVDALGQGTSQISLLLPTAHKAPVLFIDDNADALHLFQRILQGTRYQFLGSSEPEQVVQLAVDYSPRVVVLDVMLPGVDGLEVLGRLREHPQTRGIPIVISTILPYEQLALTIGATAFLRKPVSQKELLETLDRLTGL